MNMIERVRECVRSNAMWTTDPNVTATTEKVIAFAYYMGREKATREVSDRYNDLIKAQRNRAENCRYRHMAESVIGDKDYIYTSDYAKEIISIFGNDKADK